MYLGVRDCIREVIQMLRGKILIPSLRDWRSKRGVVVLSLLLVVGFFSYYYVDRYVRNVPTTSQLTVMRAEEMVKARPGDPSLRVQLGSAYLGQRRYKEAVSQFQAAIKLEEENPAAYLGMGEAYYRQGDQAQAQAAYQKVVDYYADRPERRSIRPLNSLYYNLATIYVGQGKLDEAITSLKEALAIDKVDADALKLLATVYLRQGNYDEAAKSASEAVRYVPDFLEAYETLETAYGTMGRSDLQHYAQGMVSYSRGRYGDAVGLLEGAAQRLPNHLPAQLGLAMAYEKAGQRDKALVTFKTALELDKESMLARFGVQRLEQQP